MNLPSLLGMVHLGALPGSPRFDGDLDGVIERAVADATLLVEAGFGGLMIENFGDAPFYPETVPPITVAAMTAAARAVRKASGAVIGVNVLRNDGVSALAVAAASGASMIRVNVLTGVMYTDQGMLTGRAAEIARLREQWCPEVKILADVLVKHAVPPPGLTIEQAGLDTWERGGADALVISGEGTGSPADPEQGRRLRKAVPDAPLFVGSGATAPLLPEFAAFADGVIVGSALKEGGRAENAVDLAAARRFRATAREVGW